MRLPLPKLRACLSVAIAVLTATPNAHSESANFSIDKVVETVLAASQGNTDAQYCLGQMYFFGNGIPKNTSRAVHWYRQAAEQGQASAQYILGKMYFQGEGVSKDLGRAAHWYRQAAEQDEASAQNSLGLIYATGEGVSKDYIKAYYWWNLAATSGNENAAMNRDKVEKNITAAQISKAQEMSRNFVPVETKKQHCKSSAVIV